MIELYDSEVLTIEEILAALARRAEGRRDRDAFDREIKERFADAGFAVAVNWYHVADRAGQEVPDVYMPEITINDRVQKGVPFDHDRQVHEVTNDLLELDEGGVIKTTGPLSPEQKAIRDAHAKAPCHGDH